MSAPIQLFRLRPAYHLECYEPYHSWYFVGGPRLLCDCTVTVYIDTENFWHGLAIAGALAQAHKDGYDDGYSDGRFDYESRD